MADDNWVRTAAITTVTLTQQPGAPAIDDDEVDGWLSVSTVEAVTDQPPSRPAVLHPPRRARASNPRGLAAAGGGPGHTTERR